MAKSSFRSRRSGFASRLPPVSPPALPPESAPPSPVPVQEPVTALAPLANPWQLTWGHDLARSGDWDGAAIAYGQALATYPGDGLAALALARVELRRDRPAAAWAALEPLLPQWPSAGPLLLTASQAQAAQGELALAEDLALRAWLANPDRPEARRWLAQLDRLAHSPFQLIDSWRGRLADHWLWALADRLGHQEQLTRLETPTPLDDRPFAAQVENGSLWHWRGMVGVFDAQQRLILELSDGALPHWLQTQPPRPMPTVQVAGRVAVVASGAGDAIDRWFQELLPRLQVLQSLESEGGAFWEPFAAIVVDRLAHPWQRETLDRLGIPPDRLLELDQHLQIQADSLIVPRRFNGPSSYGVAALRELGESFERSALVGFRRSLPSCRRWVLCASDGRDRPWLNGPAVAQDLTRWGFSLLDPAACSLAELIAIFQTAEAIVSPSHPALALLPLCPADTIILEVGSRTYQPLVQLAGLQGRSIPAEPAPPGNASPVLWVRSAEVRAVLARCLRGLRV